MYALAPLKPSRIFRGIKRRVLQQQDKGTARDIPNIPLPFEVLAYRVNNSDIAMLSDAELSLHYQ